MTPQALRASSPCQGELWVVYSPTRRASRGPLRRLRRQLTLQGSLWRLRIWVLRETIVPCRRFSPGGERGGAGSPAHGTRREKVFSQRYVPRHNVASPMPAHRSPARDGRAVPADNALPTSPLTRVFCSVTLPGGKLGRLPNAKSRIVSGHSPAGSLRDAFFCRHKRKRPSGKTKTPQVTLRRSCGYGSLEEENHFNVGCGLPRASVRK